jgi:DNA adenine methylase
MRGPLGYIGGKTRVAHRLIAFFPPHRTYVEPFVGGGAVLFAKPPSRVEVVNDIDGDVVNFLRCCQLHQDELIRYLAFTVASRQMHVIYSRQDPDTLTDIQRAARFLFLQRNSFAGRVTGRSFHYSVMDKSNYNPTRLPEVLKAAARRLERVQVEQRPYQEVLDRFDRPSSFFFCDPPYIGRKLYRANLEDGEFAEMAERLGWLRGKFLLTINDCELARKLFSRFNIQEFSMSYSCARSAPKVRELLVSNYPHRRLHWTSPGHPSVK